MTPREQFIANLRAYSGVHPGVLSPKLRVIAAYDDLVAERDEARDRVARIVAWLRRDPWFAIPKDAPRLTSAHIADAIEAGDYDPPKAQEPR